ncbi:MAG: hypothetical protein MT334_01840 [Candidatus Nitrosopumilus limneticus]|nr:hypothetical protein [Candidatus Nitrosopumilus limneticus]MDA0668818.1 hypothetical protein [Thermoproteota archaeon]MSS86036.1 hypothetical protein [Nitrosopumilus sp.]PHY04943.1 MAG: hypothetical protein CK526_00070 [Nitrososphaerota archaeon]MDA0854143.1 hypothetical protein [Thermoproteota archaeon]
MISFEYRVLSEYKLKISKVDTLAKSIMEHREPKGVEATEASEFLDVLVNEIDGFYKDHSEILSKNGKKPHARSRLPETKEWIDNIQRFYELNPRQRQKK